MTWDNAVWISSKSAEHYGVTTGDVVEVEFHGRTVDGAVSIMPGQADESLTVHFGYGRTRAGKVADGIGFDAYRLRATGALWQGTGANITRKSHGYKFANTQHTQTMEERDPFRAATFAEFHRNPEFARPEEKRVAKDLSMFPMWEYKQHKWGMSIDLNSCTGCNACTIACQSENNIPVVGKEEVAKGRHMNWLRVDRYFKGSSRRSGNVFPARPLHALRGCPVRTGVPGGRNRTQRGGPERNGIQPLRRYSLLFQ